VYMLRFLVYNFESENTEVRELPSMVETSCVSEGYSVFSPVTGGNDGGENSVLKLFKMTESLWEREELLLLRR